MMGMAAAVLLSSCVKDTLYDTPHPDSGKIAVTADWSARGEGIDIPTTWTVTMGDYTGTETSATHAPNHLFAPGSYTLAVWNPTEGITVNGTTATIAAATGTRAGTDTFVNNAPGWFFTYTEQVTIEKDKDYPLTAAMKQQVRELTLIIKPTGLSLIHILSCRRGAGTGDEGADGGPSLLQARHPARSRGERICG